MPVPTLTLSWPEPDIALATFDAPGKGANVLSEAVLGELAEICEALAQRDDVAGLILRSAKPGVFLAGADLREFASHWNMPAARVEALCRRGQSLFGRLAELPLVTVAAISGVCLGGGAELALWCDRRLLAIHPKTEFGLPEVKLGLFPGWGGTVRLPRLIGLANAVEIITGGESLTPAAAARLGLAHDLTSPDDLLAAAVRLVRAEQRSGDFRRDRARARQPVQLSDSELYFLAASSAAVLQRETKGNYPAPLAALNLMGETALLDEATALAREAEGMARLFGSPVNRALVNVFFLTDYNKKAAGSLAPAEAVEPVCLGVAGAGLMGRGIAAAGLRRDFPVALFDAACEALAAGTREALAEAAYDRQQKGPSPPRLLELAGRLNAASQPGVLAPCQAVIEAITENAEAKQALLANLEQVIAPDALLASNTSTLPIARLAAGLARPERFCGLHFFNPVRQMKLVEVIRGPQTSAATVGRAVALARRLGKFPVVVADGPGFLVNRLLSPYLNEALALVQEGVDLKQLDRAAVAFGMPLGPIALYDLVGLDTALYAGLTLYDAFRERAFASPLLPALVKAGRLGQKTGQGFYSYRSKRQRAEADPAALKILEPYVASRQQLSATVLQERLLLPMLLEATRLISEGQVGNVRDIDLGVVFGLGFPAFRGGLLYWADTLGPRRLLEMLQPYQGLGARFAPTPLLEEQALADRRFYDLPPA